jgi:hypothetical protein
MDEIRIEIFYAAAKTTKLTQRRGSIDTTRHGKHACRFAFDRLMALGDDTEVVDPRQDAIVQIIVADRDATSTLLLQLPALLFNGMGDRHESGFIRDTLPILFQGKLEFAIRSHAGKAKSGGGNFHGVADGVIEQ